MVPLPGRSHWPAGPFRVVLWIRIRIRFWIRIILRTWIFFRIHNCIRLTNRLRIRNKKIRIGTRIKVKWASGPHKPFLLRNWYFVRFKKLAEKSIKLPRGPDPDPHKKQDLPQSEKLDLDPHSHQIKIRIWIRIRIKVISRICIRINVIRIHNNACRSQENRPSHCQ